MKHLIPILSLVLASCAVEVGGPVRDASHYAPEDDVIYVAETPPPPRHEVRMGSPAPNHVWVGGYWRRGVTGWQWVDGRWMAPPRPGVVWVPGHWQRHPRGHVWVSGHWR